MQTLFTTGKANYIRGSYHEYGAIKEEQTRDFLKIEMFLYLCYQFHQFKWDTSIFEKEGHVPIKGFYQGLRNAFANWSPPLKVFLNGSVEELKTHFVAKNSRCI